MNACRACWLFCLLIVVLCPGFLSRPAIQAQEAKPPTKEFRTWKSNDGGFSTEAALVEQKGEGVVLRRKDGKVITVPLEKLSLNDRLYVFDSVKKPAAVPTAAPPANSVEVDAAFDVDAIIKSWNQPRELLQVSPYATITLDRKPDIVEFSANGELLYVVYFKEARHLIYGAKDGKLIQTIEYGTAPLTAAAITPNGKHLVATLGEQGTGVYDVGAKKEVGVHPEIKNVSVLQTTTGKNTFILGAKASGEFYRYQLLGGFGATFPRFPTAPPEVPKDASTDLFSGSDGKFLVVRWSFNPKLFYACEWDDDGRMKEHNAIELDADKLTPVGVGQRAFHFMGTKETWCNMMPTIKTPRAISHEYTGTATPQCFMASDDSHALVYDPGRARLYIRHVTSTYGSAISLRLGTKTDFIRLHWDSGQVAACDATGLMVLLRLRGHHHRNEKIVADVRACLESKQDDRLEKLTAALEKDHTFYPDGSHLDTKYSRVVGILAHEAELLYPDSVNPAWKAWQERNPNSRLTRFVRLQKLVDEAWKARGGDFAIGATEEGMRVCREKLNEAEPIIESFAKEPTILPAAYPFIFVVAKGQKWDEAKTTPYVERMLKECPENIPGHVEYAYSRQPRWGGTIEGAWNYAERVRKEFPGAVGDSAYSAIALALYFCNTYRIFEGLGFDKELAQAGVKQLYRDNLNTPHHRQAEVLMAVMARNGPGQRSWHAEMVKHRDAWVRGVMKEKTFDEIMDQLAPTPVVEE